MSVARLDLRVGHRLGSSGPPARRQLAGAALRVAVLPVECIVVVSAMLGWLYWIRQAVATWPGPSVAALPLDELASHDRVPLLVLLPVLAIATALLGLSARLLRVDRLVAASVLGVSCGLWSYVHVAASYYVVRQIPLSQAASEAASSPSIYLLAGIAALGGALLGRTWRSGGVITALAATGVALVGAMDVVAAFAPGRHDPFATIAPSVLLPVARAVDLPVGLLLIVSSRGLARRSRSAWWISVLALGLSSFAHLAVSPSRYPGTMLMLALVAVLIARRSRYRAHPDPARLAALPWRVALVLVLATAVAMLGILAHQASAAEPLSLGRTFVEAVRTLAGRPLDPAVYRGHSFGVWFPWSVAASLALGVLWAVVPSLAPWRPSFQRGHDDLAEAQRLVRRHGRDSLAPFALRADKALFFASTEGAEAETDADSGAGAGAGAGAVIAYRVVRGVALASGAPIGHPAARRRALESFVGWAHQRGWIVGVLGVSAEDLPLYDSLGLTGIYHGDEAFIDVDRFTLAGGRMKAVRQAVNRVERLGFQSAVLRAGDVSPRLRDELARVEQAYIAGRRRTGFAMELDDLFRLGGDDAVFVLGGDRDGRMCGLLHLAACPASSTMSLSSMPRLSGLPNGFTSWLIVRAVEWCALHGVSTLSLNFSPLAGLFDADSPQSAWRRAQRRAAERVKGALSLQLDNLQLFNRQFCPDFRARYVVLERWTDLPRVVVAAMAAEGYLPFAERLRGWPAPLAREPSAGRPHVDTPAP